jgi:hypothetical protein
MSFKKALPKCDVINKEDTNEEPNKNATETSPVLIQ